MSDPMMDFMIIGAQKSGTTALAHFLAQHPDICMASPKETHLFDETLLTGEWTVDAINESYRPFVEDAAPGQLLGEATPIYLYWQQIPPRLMRYNPALKLIVLLRDPVDRAISQYEMERARGKEPLSLFRALLAEPWRLWRARGDHSPSSGLRVFSYLDRGRYRRQLENLYRSFPPEQVLCIATEQLWQRHDATLRRVFRFLDVDDNVHIPQEKVFASGKEPRSAFWVRKLLRLVFFWERRWLARLFSV